jgi:hypothetical protein
VPFSSESGCIFLQGDLSMPRNVVGVGGQLCTRDQNVCVHGVPFMEGEDFQQQEKEEHGTGCVVDG